MAVSGENGLEYAPSSLGYPDRKLANSIADFGMLVTVQRTDDLVLKAHVGHAFSSAQGG